MFFYFFLLFVVLLVVEIAILVGIGQATAWWVPFAIIIVTGVGGTMLARWQGTKVLERIREEIRAGRVPGDALIDGFLVLVAGILFLLPGVLTDLVGIGLLVPPVRTVVKRIMQDWIKKSVQVRMSRTSGGSWPTTRSAAESRHDQIIDAKVLETRVEDAKK
jgi:UPF0716 protein FxsA